MCVYIYTHVYIWGIPGARLWWDVKNKKPRLLWYVRDRLLCIVGCKEYSMVGTHCNTLQHNNLSRTCHCVLWDVKNILWWDVKNKRDYILWTYIFLHPTIHNNLSRTYHNNLGKRDYIYTCVYIYTHIYTHTHTALDYCGMERIVCVHRKLMCVVGLVDQRDMTRWYVCHDSLLCVTWLIDMCDMTHCYVWHDLLICVPWLIVMCDVTHWYVWHDSLLCVTWLVDMCGMTHCYVWHDSLICVAWLILLCDVTWLMYHRPASG